MLRGFEKQSAAFAPTEFAVGLDGDRSDLDDALQGFGAEVGVIDEQAEQGQLSSVDGHLRQGHADERAVFDEPAVGMRNRCDVGKAVLCDGNEH